MMRVKRRISAVSREKKFAKPLDNWHKVCYNLNVNKGCDLPPRKELIIMTNTTTTKRPTKRMQFEALLSLSDVQNSPSLVAFIEHELELLDKKNSAERKPTTKQVENVGVKSDILEIVQAEPNRLFTISDILKALGNADFTNQKISALVRQMYDITGENPDGEQFALLRIMDKRKAYFKFNPNYEG